MESKRQDALFEIYFGIFAGVLGLVLSPRLARLLTRVEGWGGPKLNLYWLLLILGSQTTYWLWRLWKHFSNRSEH
jgi:hypothetical protein